MACAGVAGWLGMPVPGSRSQATTWSSCVCCLIGDNQRQASPRQPLVCMRHSLGPTGAGGGRPMRARPGLAGQHTCCGAAWQRGCSAQVMSQLGHGVSVYPLCGPADRLPRDMSGPVSAQAGVRAGPGEALAQVPRCFRPYSSCVRELHQEPGLRLCMLRTCAVSTHQALSRADARRDLQESYLPAFQACVQQGQAASVMCRCCAGSMWLRAAAVACWLHTGWACCRHLAQNQGLPPAAAAPFAWSAHRFLCRAWACTSHCLAAAARRGAPPRCIAACRHAQLAVSRMRWVQLQRGQRRACLRQ